MMIGKIFTLGVLYFVQGLPYGFQDKFIPMYLRSGGLSHTRLALMKLLLLPWLCKAVFAPFIDLFWTKWLWLMFSLGALTFISFLGMFMNTEYFILMSVWLLILNFLTAFQDVSVDALALHILQDCEMGHGNTAQIVGYKLGALFGGGILFWIHYYQGWTYLCLSLASLYIMSIVAFLPMFTNNLMLRANASVAEKIVKEKKNDEKEDRGDAVPRPFSIEETHENLVRRRNQAKTDTYHFREEVPPLTSPTTGRRYNVCEIPQIIFATKGTIPAVLLLLFYKLGERGALSTFPIFLIDQGVSTKDIGLWSGICGQLCSLAGSICSGWFISKKWNLYKFLQFGLLVRSIPIFIQFCIVNLWHEEISLVFRSILFFFSASSLCALEFAAGLVTTAIFTLMMSCSLKAPPSLQATHYSVLASVEVAGKLIFSSFAGALIDAMGISKVYFMFFVLTPASTLILRYIDTS
ncbi:major facilitator superfamily domain-containing protein 3 [Trichonephila clavata]|uniref:Major facilitator superfamily domain-containing protein 3 n=1 Tax=Trichonephila clavata TaxID=2740835 RepID=A0A8X6LS40_TRICU|nr:major facilitator superfamily domain-containing protein 3 [Trichonephila clavata]